MDNLVLQKIIVVFILILFVLNEFRRVRNRKKTSSDPAIAIADAEERHQWRYVLWIFRILQTIALGYLFVSLIWFVVS
ncbi:hypothetical protein ABDM08_004239 [Salmonella enterica]|nr:hypothetical protein [Salmonella enterica]EJQ9383902.1 hypothetical protein [Salmonella enterica]